MRKNRNKIRKAILKRVRKTYKKANKTFNKKFKRAITKYTEKKMFVKTYQVTPANRQQWPAYENPVDTWNPVNWIWKPLDPPMTQGAILTKVHLYNSANVQAWGNRLNNLGYENEAPFQCLQGTKIKRNGFILKVRWDCELMYLNRALANTGYLPLPNAVNLLTNLERMAMMNIARTRMTMALIRTAKNLDDQDLLNFITNLTPFDVQEPFDTRQISVLKRITWDIDVNNQKGRFKWDLRGLKGKQNINLRCNIETGVPLAPQAEDDKLFIIIGRDLMVQTGFIENPNTELATYIPCSYQPLIQMQVINTYVDL